MRTHPAFPRFLIVLSLIAIFASALFAVESTVGADPQAPPPTAKPAATQPAKWSASVPPVVPGNVNIALKDLREMAFEVLLLNNASDYYDQQKQQSNLTKVLMNDGTPWTILNQDQYIARFREGARLPVLQLIVQAQAAPAGDFVMYNIRLSIQEFATTARQPEIAFITTVWQNDQVGFATPNQVLHVMDERIGMLFRDFTDAWVAQNPNGWPQQ